MTKFYRWIYLIVLVLFGEKTQAQVTYQDSCLSVEFYYQRTSNNLDTFRTITLSDSSTMIFFQSDDTSLNLVVCFRNKCKNLIEIPSRIFLDMPGDNDFMMEGYHIKRNDTTVLEFNSEYDYYSQSPPYEIILQPEKIKLLKYNFPLGFHTHEKGLFKFRLRFYNQHNYKKIDEWVYYYSNWIYLEIK